jgi:hypothetical protein
MSGLGDLEFSVSFVLWRNLWHIELTRGRYVVDKQKLQFISNAHRHDIYESCQSVSDMNLENFEVLLIPNMVPVYTSP